VGGLQADYFNLISTLLFLCTIVIFERRIFALANSRKFKPLYSLIILLLILTFGVLSNSERFIYMQF
jgi:hypothetical protein